MYPDEFYRRNFDGNPDKDYLIWSPSHVFLLVLNILMFILLPTHIKV